MTSQIITRIYRTAYYVQGDIETAPGLFSILKMAAALFTYWSGIAGGIFAPCLSMGSAAGAWAASWQQGPVRYAP